MDIAPRLTPSPQPKSNTRVPNKYTTNETVALANNKNKVKLLPINLGLRPHIILPAFQSVVRFGSSAKSMRNGRPNLSIASGYVRDKIILLAKRTVGRAHLLELVVLQTRDGCSSFKTRTSFVRHYMPRRTSGLCEYQLGLTLYSLEMEPLAVSILAILELP